MQNFKDFEMRGVGGSVIDTAGWNITITVPSKEWWSVIAWDVAENVQPPNYLGVYKILRLTFESDKGTFYLPMTILKGGVLTVSTTSTTLLTGLDGIPISAGKRIILDQSAGEVLNQLIMMRLFVRVRPV
jgi:hypothetical protein